MASQRHSMQARWSADEILREREDDALPKETPKFIAPPTKRGYDLIIAAWKDFLLHVEKPKLAPTAKVLKVFFKTMVLNRKGKLSERLCISTLVAYLSCLATVLKVSREVAAEVRDWIKTDLKRTLQLSGKPRLKPVADGRDIEDLISFMWKEDSHKFRRELDRIKLHLYILLLAYTAARPGAMIGLRAMRFPGAPSDLRGTDLHQELRHHPDVLTASTKTERGAELRRLRDARAKKLRKEWIKSGKEAYLERGCFRSRSEYERQSGSRACQSV